MCSASFLNMANRKVILALRESSHRSLTPCTHFPGAKVQFLGQLITQYAGNHSLLLLLMLFRLPWPQGPQLSGAYMVHRLTWEPVCKQHFFWNTTMPIHFYIISGCFCATMAELSIWDIDHMVHQQSPKYLLTGP